jgi:hypothetical protein
MEVSFYSKLSFDAELSFYSKLSCHAKLGPALHMRSLKVGLTLLDLDTSMNIWYTLSSLLLHGNP